MSQQFVFTSQEAATAAKAGQSDRVRVYRCVKEADAKNPERVERFVLGTSQELALARFAKDALGCLIEGGGRKKAGGPSKKDYDAAVAKLVNAKPEELASAQAELKRIQDQIAAAKAKKEAAKAGTASAPAGATAPAPPAPAAQPQAPAAPATPAPPAASQA